jgi:hypothetical protein
VCHQGATSVLQPIVTHAPAMTEPGLWLIGVETQIFLFFFIFFDMSTQESGRGIRTSDLRFMRRGSQLIELPFGDKLKNIKLEQKLFNNIK